MPCPSRLSYSFVATKFKSLIKIGNKERGEIVDQTTNNQAYLLEKIELLLTALC